jgi:hypothetical protein
LGSTAYRKILSRCHLGKINMKKGIEKGGEMWENVKEKCKKRKEKEKMGRERVK